MPVRMAWLSDDDRDSIVDQALEILERVGMRFSGSQGLDALAAAGARVDPTAGVVRFSARPRHRGARAVPARGAHGRRAAREGRAARRRADVLQRVRLRRQDVRPRDGHGAALDPGRRARRHRRARCDAAAGRGLDLRHGDRRPGGASRAARVLHLPHRDGEARRLRGLPHTDRGRAPHLRRARRRSRRLPRAAARLDPLCRAVPSRGQRAADRPHGGAGRAGRAGLGVLDADRRGHRPGHHGRARWPSSGRRSSGPRP